MEVLRGHSALGAPIRGWQAELTRVLDEHHLVAWSSQSGERASFAAGLASFLAGMDDAQVIPIYGRNASDLETFCYQIERSIAGDGPMRRRVDGPAGLVSRFRSQPVIPGRPPLRLRYFVWHDPDELIQNDPGLFGQIADAIAGVAAEAEYASDDYLMITRAVYIGGEALREYAEDESGQLRSWLRDFSEEPFWRAVSGVDVPPVLTGPIGKLLEDPESIAHEAMMASLESLAY
jgi:hypothetical protein